MNYINEDYSKEVENKQMYMPQMAVLEEKVNIIKMKMQPFWHMLNMNIRYMLPQQKNR